MLRALLNFPEVGQKFAILVLKQCLVGIQKPAKILRVRISAYGHGGISCSFVTSQSATSTDRRSQTFQFPEKAKKALAVISYLDGGTEGKDVDLFLNEEDKVVGICLAEHD